MCRHIRSGIQRRSREIAVAALQLLMVLCIAVQYANCGDCERAKSERNCVASDDTKAAKEALKLAKPFFLNRRPRFPSPTPKVENVSLFAENLTDKDVLVRVDAAAALGFIGPTASPAVPALSEALRDEEPVVRWSAANAIGGIGPSARAAIPALLETLSDFERPISEAALRALEAIGPEAVGPLQSVVPGLKPQVAGRVRVVLQRLQEDGNTPLPEDKWKRTRKGSAKEVLEPE